MLTSAQDTRLSSVLMVTIFFFFFTPPRLTWFKVAEINTGPGSWMGGSELHKHLDLSPMEFVPFHIMS